jgi:TldD protein
VQERLDELIEWLSRQGGVEYAEARSVVDERQRIRLRDQLVERAVDERSAGLGVRVLYRGALGFAAAMAGGDDEAGRARRCAEEALAAARAAASVSPGRVRLCDEDPQRGQWSTPLGIDPFAVPLERKLADLSAAVDLLRQDRQGRIRSASAHLGFRRVHKRLLTSEGTDVTQTLVHGACGMQAVAAWQDDVQQRSYPLDSDGGCAAKGYELVDELALSAHAERVREEAIALCVAPALPAGRTTVILGTEQLALQIHESCGHPTESDRALGEEASLAGGSFLRPERLGRFRFGSAHVDLVAEATTPGGLGTQGWDDEGVPARRTPLVQRGQFVGYLSSRQTAARLGLGRSAGCMRAETWSRPPIVRMINVSLEPPARGPTQDELLADTREGVLFGCNRSWSIDELRLNFQFGCEAAWRIEKGRLGALCKNPFYTGLTPRFWAGCDAVCGPSELRQWGFLNCGKGDPIQTMWVGHGSAPARFRDVEVGSG